MSKKAKEYPPKILLAWGEAMAGNAKIANWLMTNGYPELISCIASMKGNTTADKWLLARGFVELLAFVECINEKAEAKDWLKGHGYDLYVMLSDFVNDEDGALQDLAALQRKEVLVLAQRLRKLISDVDTDAGDVHRSPFL